MQNIFTFEYINSFNSYPIAFLIIYSLALLCLGSFASSMIFRISYNFKKNINEISIISPRSFCPKCNQTIKLINLIPLLGFVFQRGRCSMCRGNISIFYPATEICFLLFGLGLAFVYGFGFFCFFLLFILFLFYILFFLDWKFYYLPFKCNLLLVVAGFIGNSFFNIFISDISLFFNLTPFLFSFYGFLIGYFSLWIINFIFKLIYKADGIGGGDFILFGAIGALFGPFSLGLILFISAVCGCFIFVLFKNKFKSQIPLGSCLIFGSLLYFLIKNFELLNNLIVI